MNLIEQMRNHYLDLCAVGAALARRSANAAPNHYNTASSTLNYIDHVSARPRFALRCLQSLGITSQDVNWSNTLTYSIAALHKGLCLFYKSKWPWIPG